MGLLAVHDGHGSVDREYILLAHKSCLYHVRSVDYAHVVKPTRQRVSMVQDLGTVPSAYGKKPRGDQMSTISHLVNVTSADVCADFARSGTVLQLAASTTNNSFLFNSTTSNNFTAGNKFSASPLQQQSTANMMGSSSFASTSTPTTTSAAARPVVLLADQNGTVTVSEGPPKLRPIRRLCTGSEITGLEYICDSGFKAHLGLCGENGTTSGAKKSVAATTNTSSSDIALLGATPPKPVQLLAYASRAISSHYADGRSRLRLWNYLANTVVAELDVKSEVTSLLYSPSDKALLCACWNGDILPVKRNPQFSETPYSLRNNTTSDHHDDHRGFGGGGNNFGEQSGITLNAGGPSPHSPPPRLFGGSPSTELVGVIGCAGSVLTAEGAEEGSSDLGSAADGGGAPSSSSLPRLPKGSAPSTLPPEFVVSDVAKMSLGEQGRMVLRHFCIESSSTSSSSSSSPGGGASSGSGGGDSNSTTAGVLAVSQSGKLKMWRTSSSTKSHDRVELYLDLDTLHRVGNAAQVQLLHWRYPQPFFGNSTSSFLKFGNTAGNTTTNTTTNQPSSPLGAASSPGKLFASPSGGNNNLSAEEQPLASHNASATDSQFGGGLAGNSAGSQLRGGCSLRAGDLLVVGGNETLAFVDPVTRRKVVRRLDLRHLLEPGLSPEITALCQWRDLVMVGTRQGHILGTSFFLRGSEPEYRIRIYRIRITLKYNQIMI